MSSISWRDNAVHVMRLVGDFYRNSEFTDCALDTEGGLIYGHKTILAACSPYLQKLFRDSHGMMIFALKEVNYKDMKFILDYIYCGDINAPVADMDSIRQSAELLQISSLQSASQNFLETFSPKDADEKRDRGTSGTRLGENFMKQDVTREMDVHGNRCIGFRDVHRNSELGFNTSCQNIDQPSENGGGTKPCSDSKSLSEEVVEDQSETRFTNTREIKLDTVINESEMFQDELPPLTFVDVSSASVKSEDLGDRENVTDSLLENPLEVHPNDCNAFKVQKVKEETDQTYMEIKQEIDVPELDFKITDNDSIRQPIKNVSDSGTLPLGNNFQHSYDKLTTNVEGNMFLTSKHMGVIHSNQNRTSDRALRSFCSEDCNTQKKQDVEVKFESICDRMDVENTDDVDESSSLMEANDESPCIYSVQNVSNGFGVTAASKLELKEVKVVLQRIQPPYELKAGVDKSGFSKSYRSSSVQKISSELERDLKNCSGNKESSNSLLSDAGFNSKLVLSHAADKDRFGSNNTHKEHNVSENSFSCQVCDVSFRYQCNLKKHMRSHTGEKPFKCAVCCVSFSWKGSLNDHKRIHTGEKPFKCVECNVSFRRKWGLNIHKRIHTGERPFKCAECEDSFHRKDTLKIHMRIHTGERPFKCAVCSVSFRRKSHLKTHLKTHFKIDLPSRTPEKPYKCGICDHSFSRKADLERHMRIHTGEKPFKCGECNASFRGSGCLKKHKRTHMGNVLDAKPFRCGECDVSFRSKSYLRIHMRFHTGERPFKCEVCAVSFYVKSQLNVHLRTHTGEKPFKCGECDVSFSGKGNLISHMRTHTGEKPFKCGECNTSFRTSCSLKKHERLHTAEKPFKCGECDFSFSQKEKLVIHMRYHSGENSFKCGECDVSFCRKDHLKAHKRIHFGEKPYKCGECGISFSHKGSLPNHMRIHTG